MAEYNSFVRSKKIVKKKYIRYIFKNIYINIKSLQTAHPAGRPNTQKKSLCKHYQENS